MRIIRWYFSAICVLAFAGWAPRAVAGDAIDLDQKLGQPLSLQKYGGPHKDLSVYEVDQDAIRYAIIDYTRMVWRSQYSGQTFGANASRNNNLVQVPTVTELRRNRHDHPDQGSSRIGGLYLLYEEPSTGLKIFYKDTLATPSEAVRLRIIPGKVAQH